MKTLFLISVQRIWRIITELVYIKVHIIILSKYKQIRDKSEYLVISSWFSSHFFYTNRFWRHSEQFWPCHPPLHNLYRSVDLGVSIYCIPLYILWSVILFFFHVSQSRLPTLLMHGLKYQSLFPLPPRRQKVQTISSRFQSSHLVSLWRGSLLEQWCKFDLNSYIRLGKERVMVTIGHILDTRNSFKANSVVIITHCML